jgi:hypothetical protein
VRIISSDVSETLTVANNLDSKERRKKKERRGGRGGKGLPGRRLRNNLFAPTPTKARAHCT